MLHTTKPFIGRDVAFLSADPNPVRLGFGCGGLMRLPSRRSRQRLLGEVFERGIRHFDVARMYGLGAAEGELGRFVRGCRDQITIATKFGIDPAGPADRLARFQAPARATIGRFPALRRMLKRREGAFHQPRCYDPESARVSLLKSLMELGVDHVDIFFVHDPGAVDPLEIQRLAETLEELRQVGYVGAWGFSGELEHCLPLRGIVDVPTVLQVRDDIFARAPARIEANEACVTFGVLSDALNQVLTYLDGAEERRVRWSETVGRDCGRPEVIASLLLQDAMERNSGGGVLFSTKRVERVGAAVEAAEALQDEAWAASVRAFRDLVLEEINDRGEAGDR
jgi:D-threo-aldose 1-dehydrogenase